MAKNLQMLGVAMRRTLSWFLLAVAWTAVTLAGYQQVAEKPVAGETKPSPPKLRLADDVRPTRYALDLTILPTEDSFRGSIDIDVRLRAATSLIWLNATELLIEQATLNLGSRNHPTRLVAGNDDFSGFALERPVGPGNARLHMEYKGALNKTETAGATGECRHALSCRRSGRDADGCSAGPRAGILQ